MLTEREKKLMLTAFSVGFTEGMADAENGYSNQLLSERFKEWLETPASDCGHTIEMIIDSES